MKTFGSYYSPDGPRLSIRDTWALLKANLVQRYLPPPPDHEAALPEADPERTAEAISRALPELIKLERFEKSALARRDQALSLLRERLRTLEGARLDKTNPNFYRKIKEITWRLRPRR